MSCVVQDYEGLREKFDAVRPLDIKSRVTFEAHDFFTPQPIQGADVYLLKHILHDWPDRMAAKILQGIVTAMTKNSRIIIYEGVLPEPNTVPKPMEKLATNLDLQMMTLMNAKERTREDWTSLCREADKRLVTKNFIQPFGSVMGIIEVVLED
jgi:6-hydroxytryprostatin B O-methyltransferase